MTRQPIGMLLLAVAMLATGVACAAPAAPVSKPTPAAAAPAGAAAASAGAAAAPAAAAAASVAAPVAPSASVAPAAPAQRFTVRMGGISGIIDRPLWTGEDKGYFREQGIALEIENFTTTVDMVAPLATGRIDAGHGAVNAGLFNAFATGVPLKIVSNMNILRPPGEGIRNYYQVVVRKDLAAQVRDMKDLRGMRVAINAPAAQAHAWRALQYHGMRLEDVQLENVTFAEQIAALTNRAIDASLLLEPLVIFGQERGVLEPLFDLGYAMPDYPVAMLFYGADFIQSQPEAGRRFMVGYMKTLRYLEDAVVKRQNWPELVQLHIANTAVKDAAVYDKMADIYSETSGSIGVEALEADQEFYLQHGLQRERLNIRDLVDRRFGEHALQVLGPYQR